MENERRQNTIDSILISLGRLESAATQINTDINGLQDKVRIQNGKVGALERWQAFIQGALVVIAAVLLPMVLNFIMSWVNHQVNLPK